MANVPSQKIVVLIVEDEPILRMFAALTIEEAGFAVLEAENADEAIRILETRSDVRIVFTDIDMPGSMDGIKLAAAVRGRWPPIRIMLTSGYRSVTASELPARSVFLQKPYQPERVVAMLHQMMA
jgi:CheY-like chemotaxis protein